MVADPKGRFTDLWIAEIAQSDLPPAVRHVGRAMAFHADWQTGDNVWPSAQRIADETGYSRRRVLDHRRALVAAGFAVEVSKGGSPVAGRRENSKFRLVIPTVTSDPVSPVLVTPATPTGDVVSPYRSKNGSSSSTDSAPGTRPPMAAVGSNGASPAKAGDEDDRPSAGGLSDRWLTAAEIRSARASLIHSGGDVQDDLVALLRRPDGLPAFLPAPQLGDAPLPDDILEPFGIAESDDAGWYEAVMAWWGETGKDKPCSGCDDYFDPYGQVDKFLSYYQGQTSKRWGYVYEAWIGKGHDRWSDEHADHRRQAKAKLEALPDGEFLEVDYQVARESGRLRCLFCDGPCDHVAKAKAAGVEGR